MITKQEIIDQREELQNDLDCFLDGIDEILGHGTFDKICDLVVKRFDVLLEKDEE